MKILHVYQTAYPDTFGGVEQSVHQIARGCARLGIETSVLSLTQGEDVGLVELDGYSIHRMKMMARVASTALSMSIFSKFSELVESADLVHYHFPWPLMDLLYLWSGTRTPAVVTYHSDIIKQKNLLRLYRPIAKMFLGRVQRIVATSPNYLESSTVLREYSQKVSVIPLGLDRETYPDPPPELLDVWRARLPPRFFLFIGVIRYYKGLHVLLDATAGGDMPIVIVGEGPEEAGLREQAKALGLRSVFFLGRLSDADRAALLALCYAMVFPSHLRSEAFGISLLEGAMFGKALISSEISTGTSFVNIDEVTGLVVAPSDSAALREAMARLWQHPDQTIKFGQAARERYWEIFTADRMVAQYVDLYSKTIGRKAVQFFQ